VQLTGDELESYLASTALLLERYGVVLDLEEDEALALEESHTGRLSFSVRGFLPDGRQPPQAIVQVREIWRLTTANGPYERTDYAYELLDHERNDRRAFHLHDPDVFVRRHDVVVHEHCERPIGSAPCAHVSGFPVRDAFAGVERLIDVWLEPRLPDCDGLPCLE
jgi:hypothetical protein